MNLIPIAKRVVNGKIDFQTAAAFVTGVFELVETIDDISTGLKGAQKLEAVKDGAWTLAQVLKIDDDFERLWQKLGPYISLVVKILKLTKPPVQPAPL